MSSNSLNVDQRIVQMQFDNAQFEQGATTTMNTLDKLKQSLDFTGQNNGISALSKSIGNFTTAPMISSLESAKSGFSALQVAAITAISNITTRVQAMGEKLVKAVTVDPVKSGWNEYESKMDSIKTILNSAKDKNGAAVSLDQVKKKIEELNEYADKTIYSFADMTNNIGKFTNAGVDLDTSVKAIQGVANAAAAAGADSNAASRAMYNFAQALSVGYVQRIDWKSIENANMATVEFKNELLKTAAELKTVEQRSDGTYMALTKGSKTMKESASAAAMFTENLSTQWLTNDVMIKTLERYSDTETDIGKKAAKAATQVFTLSKMFDTLGEAMQSGWSATWEKIVGDYEQAGELFTGINDFISGALGKRDQKRIDFLDELLNKVSAVTEIDWKKFASGFPKGAQGKTNQDLHNYIEIVKKVAREHNVDIDGMIQKHKHFKDTLKEGWFTKDIFDDVNKYIDSLKTVKKEGDPKYTKKQVAALKEISKSLGDADSAYSKIGSSFTRIKSGRELIIDSFKKVFKQVLNLYQGIKYVSDSIFPKPSVKRIYESLEAINKWANGFKISTKTLGRFQNTFRGVFSIIDIFRMALVAIGKGVLDVVKRIMGFGGSVLDTTASIGKSIYAFRNWIKQSKIFDKAVGAVSGALITFINLLSQLGVFRLIKVGLILVANILIRIVALVFQLFNAIISSKIAIALVNAILYVLQGIAMVIGTVVSKLIDFVANFGKLKAGNKAMTTIGNIFKTIASLAYAGVIAVINGLIKLGDKLRNSETANKIFTAIATAIGAIATVIDKVVSKVSDFVKRLLQLEAVQKTIEKIKTFFKELGPNLKTLGGKGLEKVTKFFADIKKHLPSSETVLSTINGLLDGSIDKLKFIKDLVGKGFKNVTDFFGDTFSNLFGKGDKGKEAEGSTEGLSKAGETIKETLSKFGESVSKGLGKVNAASILAVSIFATFIYVFIQIGRLIRSINKFMKGITLGEKNPLTTFLNSMTKALNSYAKKNNSEVFLNIMKGISMLALSMAILSLCDTEKLIQVTADLIVIMLALRLVLGGFERIFSHFSNAGNASESLEEALAGLADSFSNIVEKIGKALSKGALLIGIGVAVALIVYALGQLYLTIESGKEHISSLIIACVGIAAIIATLIGVLYLIDKLDLEIPDGLGTALVGIGLALVLIAKAITAFPTDPNHFGRGLIAFALILGLMTASFYILSKVTENGGSLLKIAGSMLILAIAISALTVPLAILSLFNPDRIIAAGAALGLVAVCLGIFAAMGSKITPKTAAALALMAVSLGLLMTPLLALAKLDSGQLTQAAVAFGALIVVLGVLVFLSEGLTAGVAAMSAAFLSLGAMAVMVGAGVYLIVAAFSLLGPALSSFIDGLVYFCDGLIKNASTIAAGLSLLFLSICAALIAAKPMLAAATSSTFSALFTGISSAILEFLPSGMSLIKITIPILILTLIGVLETILPGAVKKIVNLIILAINTLASTIVNQGQGLARAVLNLLDAIGILLLYIWDESLKWLAKKFQTLTGIDLTPILDKLNLDGKLEEFKKDFNENLDLSDNYSDAADQNEEAKKEWQASATPDVVQEGIDTGGLITAGGQTTNWDIETQTPTNEEAESDGQSKGTSWMTGWLSSLTLSSEEGGTNVMESFTKGLSNFDSSDSFINSIDTNLFNDEGMIDLGSAKAQTLMESFGGAANFSEIMGNMGEDGWSAFSGELSPEKMQQLMSTFNTSAEANVDLSKTKEKVGKQTKEVADEANKNLKEVGKDTDKNPKEIIKNQKQTVKIEQKVEDKSAKSSMKTSAENTAKSWTASFRGQQDSIKTNIINTLKNAAAGAKSQTVYASFKSSGVYTANGLLNGLESKMESLYNKGVKMAQKVNSGYKNTVEQHSPSRVFFKNALFTAQGLLNGFDSKMGDVYKAGAGMGEAATDGTRTALAQMSSLLAGNMDTTPTIRPVLDLTDVANGARSINGMLGGRTLSVNSLTANSLAASMNSRQNRSDMVLSALDNLSRTMSQQSSGNTYNINGITYDDGSNIATAIGMLAHAAIVEGRA